MVTPPVSQLVDLRLLRVFLAISDTGNMTASAKLLGLTQSAVSQGLRQLESDFQVSLFARNHRPLQLTTAGIALRERARRLVDEANQLPSLIQEIGCDSLPAVRIGLVDSFGATVGPYLIRELLESTMHLSAYSGLAPLHNEALKRRTVDLVVTSDPLDDEDGLERHLLMQEPALLVVPADCTKDISRLNLDQIAARYPLVRYSAHSHLGGQVDRHLRRLGIHAPRTIEVDNSDTVVAMVAAGVGYAISTPLCYLQGRASADRAKAIPLPGTGFNRTLMLIARTGEYAELPRQVSRQIHRILNTEIVGELRRLIPWLGAGFVVGEDQPETPATPPQ